MGSFSIVHWIIVLAVLASTVVPPWIIVRKAGYHPAWSLLGLIPLVNIVVLWVFAFGDWPALRRDHT
ncbi:MAG TPA: hypothetical protein PLF78_11210 [Caulobacter sp.]|nr:hypothetical protein [Caulobacter sp.]